MPTSGDPERFAEVLVLKAHEARSLRHDARRARELVQQAVEAIGLDAVRSLARECVVEFPFLDDLASAA